MSEGEVSEEGKLWAVLSYAGFFFGLPISIVPLIMRDDPYAVKHAKHATGVYLAFMVAFFAIFLINFMLFFCTFGLSNFIAIPLLMLLMLWPFGTAIHGLIITLNGQWDEPYGSFGIGDKMFAGVVPKDTSDARPPPTAAASDAEEVKPADRG